MRWSQWIQEMSCDWMVSLEPVQSVSSQLALHRNGKFSSKCGHWCRCFVLSLLCSSVPGPLPICSSFRLRRWANNSWNHNGVSQQGSGFRRAALSSDSPNHILDKKEKVHLLPSLALFLSVAPDLTRWNGKKERLQC